MYDQLLPDFATWRGVDLLGREARLEEWKNKCPSWLIEALFRLLHRYGRPPLKRPKRLSFVESEIPPRAKHRLIAWILDTELRRLGIDLPFPEPLEGLRSYYPLLETRDNYLADLRDQAAESMREHVLLRYAAPIETIADSVRESNAIANYCQNVEDAYAAQGFKRRPATEKKGLKRHLEWTARVWFGEERPVAIQKELQLKGERGSISAITQAVQQILDIVNDDTPILNLAPEK